MRQVLSTALVALVVSLLTVTVTGALAQEPAQPAPEAVVTAGANADTVDGKHAVSATNKKSARRNRLVATDAKGFLPSNIVKPKWPLIQLKPAAFVDGQIGWDEVVGIPGPFADGVDNEGVTGLVVTRKSAYKGISPGAGENVTVSCPAGSILVGGGHAATSGDVYNVTSQPSGSGWYAYFENTGGVTVGIYAYAFCLATQPAGSITQAGKVKPAVKPKRGT